MKLNAGPSTGPCYQRHDAATGAARFLIARFTESKCLDRALFSALLLLPAESVEFTVRLRALQQKCRLEFQGTSASRSLSLLRKDFHVGKYRAEIIAAFRDDDGRLDDDPHRRRPRATTATENRHILEAALGDPFRAARDIRDALELEISDTTVRRRLYDAGLHSRVACQSPLLMEKHSSCGLTSPILFEIGLWRTGPTSSAATSLRSAPS
ncbi:hypothetical protein HPB47_011534 [Ixodes persulcatus]|uniref:Uncharacterized protein n=1 Tax=Ixodes persulcatus TaxID=34615 RepID=A0AC60NW19_IXOPE|nr:hypothetical protein HPB47_011534 [Ixodes persulcatus]